MRDLIGHQLLPGGIVRQGKRLRAFTPSTLCGHVELALSLGPEPGPRFHASLNSALSLGIERIGDERVTEPLAAELAIGDRQFLARMLGIQRIGDLIWLSPMCTHCDSRFDLPVRQSQLPVKPAGGEFPTTIITLKAGAFRCRVPTGSDQLAVAEADISDTRRWLIDRLIEDAPRGFMGATDLDDEDLDRADAAIEDASPEVCTIVETTCPVCDQPSHVEVSPYLGLLQDDSDLIQEVHQIASHYHWSQSEILELPSSRRHRYLLLIDHARGVRA